MPENPLLKERIFVLLPIDNQGFSGKMKKNIKNWKKVLTYVLDYDKLIKLSEGHELQNIRKRLGRRKALWLAEREKAFKKLPQKSWKSAWQDLEDVIK